MTTNAFNKQVPTENPRQLGENAKLLRELHSYTQEFVADKLGLSRYWYGQLECGLAAFKKKHIDKLSELYKVPQNCIVEFDRTKLKNYFLTTTGASKKSQILRNNSDKRVHESYEMIITAKNEMIELLKEENRKLLKLLEMFQNQNPE